ncbi:MAG TPA: TRAP transporter large permease [Candidatus Baltobacteraceae bacterium]|nr:TRAP transporter large permease [Candidatus Baltobacteraceae bacterium]
MSGFEVLGLFLLLAMLGVPLAASMGLAAVAYIVVMGVPLSTVAHRMTNSINSFPLLAVVLFIYVGNLMNATGLTHRLYDAARVLVGRVRGGLAYVNVLANLVMAGISGSALADVGALGNVQIKAMKEQGYPVEVAAAITASAATLGPIFPPSIPMIIYAGVAEVSGVKLLIAGMVPALVIALCLCIQVWYYAHKHNYPRDSRITTWREKARILAVAVPALSTPVVLVFGLLFGFFGPTELAAFTVCYAVLLGSVVYRELTWKACMESARETVRATAIIMFIVSAAAIFAWVLTVEQLPEQMSVLLLSISRNPWVLLMIVNGMLLVAGCFMESIAAIMVMTPLIVPPLYAAGVDPVHLGVVVVLNLMIGLLTPPVGMSLYMVSIISKVPFARMARVIWPFLIPLLVSLIIVTLVPGISTWLPEMVFKK